VILEHPEVQKAYLGTEDAAAPVNFA
jgi:hypothetical protein